MDLLGYLHLTLHFDGSISDKEIVRKFGILEKHLWKAIDILYGVYVLRPLNVYLNITAFFLKDQPTAAEVEQSQTIALVHLERAMQ